MLNFFITVLGAFLGAFASWAITYRYHKLASQDLSEEAKKLRKLNTLIIKGLEEAELAEFNRDLNGEPTGLVIKLAGRVEAKSSMHGTLSGSRKSPSSEN